MNRFVLVLSCFLLALSVRAQTPVKTSTEPAPPAVAKYLGVTINSFFYGPAIDQITPGGKKAEGYDHLYPVRSSGLNDDNGIYFYNYFSVRYKFSTRFAVDLQLRNQMLITSCTNSPHCRTEPYLFRHQGQRLGISGKLLHGETWSLTGALNSDIPIAGIMGQAAEERTLIVNPGTFANFMWRPVGSRWHMFALVTPRYYFYRDPDALSSQDRISKQGKANFVLTFNPSINYDLDDKNSLRFGMMFDYRKNSDWKSPRRWYWPFEFGVTHKISKHFSVYPSVNFSTPLDDEVRRFQGQQHNNWKDTVTLNMWISGVLF